MSPTTLTTRTRAALALPAMVAAALMAAGQARAGDFADGGVALQAGGAVIAKPKYEGSKDYEVMGAPIVAPAGEGSGTVQFKGVDDLRFRFLNHSGFEAGPLVGYRFDREEDDAARLGGLGDVDGGVVVGGYLAYRIGMVAPFVSYHHQVTGDDTGGLARFGVETKLPVTPWLLVTATGGATWADDDYMASYFGVTAAQNAASTAGLAIFDAEAGIKDVYVSLSADVPIGERWSLKLGARYAHLLGDAADSPVVETESQWQGTLGVTYRFGAAR